MEREARKGNEEEPAVIEGLWGRLSLPAVNKDQEEFQEAVNTIQSQCDLRARHGGGKEARREEGEQGNAERQLLLKLSSAGKRAQQKQGAKVQHKAQIHLIQGGEGVLSGQAEGNARGRQYEAPKQEIGAPCIIQAGRIIAPAEDVAPVVFVHGKEVNHCKCTGRGACQKIKTG